MHAAVALIGLLIVFVIIDEQLGDGEKHQPDDLDDEL